MNKEKGCVTLHNGKRVCGKEKCNHCEEYRRSTTWYAYCELNLEPEDCDNAFEEAWRQVQ